MSRTNPTTDLPLFRGDSAAEPAGFSSAHAVPLDATTASPRPLFVEGSATSEAAAVAMEPKRQSKRQRVFMYILGQGHRGATRKEIAAALTMSENTVRPRVRELSDEHDPAYGCPRVFETGLKEDVRDGCSVLYAGMYAKAAFDRAYREKVPAA